MLAGLENPFHGGGSLGAHRLAAFDHARGGPFQVLMFFGPVLGQGGVTAGRKTSGVSSDAAALEEDLNGGGGEAGFDLLVDTAVGNAVVVAVDLDVVVDVDPRLLPLGEDEGFGGQRLEPRPLQFLKQPARVSCRACGTYAG